MMKELVETFEELKNYVFIIYRGSKKPIIIKFKNDNFYHLVGLHKTNIDMFFPKHIISKDKKYKYIKKNIEKFDNILKNQIQEKDSLEFRIKTFRNIIDLLKNNDKTSLYSLKQHVEGSMYNGDYGLFKTYEEMYCLFGLKEEKEIQQFVCCVPQSWMAGNRTSRLILGKKPLYMEYIVVVPTEVFDNNLYEIYA